LSVLKGSTRDLTLLTSGAVADGTTDGVGRPWCAPARATSIWRRRTTSFSSRHVAYTAARHRDVITPVGFRGGGGEVLQNFGENGGNVGSPREMT